MLRHWLWVPLWLAANAAFGVTAGLVPLPVGATDGKAYAAKFTIGLTADGGSNWVTSANLNQKLSFKVSVDPDPAHVGQKGDVFVVGWNAGTYLMLSSTGTWQPWSGKVAELKPWLDDTTLATTQQMSILQGAITAAGEYRIYIGYTAANSTALIYTTTPASFTFKQDPLSYFTTKVFDNIVMAKCALCHVDNGAATGSALRFIRDSNKATQNYDIFKIFYNQLNNGYNYVLGKASGGNGHLGGIQLQPGSSDYQTLANFLDLLEGAKQISTGTTAALLDGVSNQSAIDTLRDASLLLAGRLPTAAELTTVAAGGDSSFKQVLIAMMNGTNFHNFLKDGADDRLLLRGNVDFNMSDDCTTCFPTLNEQYWVLKDKADAGTAADRGALTLWMSQLNYSTVEGPLELIAYVVENDRPYSEIITADYEMFTPVLNAAVAGTAVFPSGAASTEFRPGKINSYYLRDTGTVLQQVPAGAALPRITTLPKLVVPYPHVGVLASKSFLSRYPTTGTNRNRARARWAYYHFLGVDIEALAKRTTDPVALADTNNPTMKNPACTVCHNVLDPVAGTFQDFFDNGTYRSSINGTDSLDRFYKAAPVNTRLYKTGDTWYRDMRDPGFEGTKAPANSLRWLAEQIAKDKRFASASVRFWWPAVMGSDLLDAPEVTDDANYAARLSAYEGQQAEVGVLTDKFVQSGLKLKSLLADMVLSKWYRADKLQTSQVNALQSEARKLASVSGEKLLTPEALARKTKALTGFNWNAQNIAASGEQLNGLELDYTTFYGGIDGFVLKKRARALTPMMTNVASAHALETSCPIVLGDFIRPDTQRFLFNGLSPWVTPLTEQTVTAQMSSTSETDFKPFTLTATLPAGSKQVVLTTVNDACDYSASATTCKANKNLVINTISIKNPNGQTTTLAGTTATYGSCAANTGNSRLTLYSSCPASYSFTADVAGTYTITASLAAKQLATDPVVAAINIEAVGAASASTTAGATLIKNKLVELHSKLLGQTVTVTSPEVLASYDLLVQTLQSRKAGNSAPSLLQSKTLACDWSTDIGFIGTLGYPDNPFGTNGRYNTTPVTNWLTPQAQDPLLMKQSWGVVMAYLLSHYDYLHE